MGWGRSRKSFIKKVRCELNLGTVCMNGRKEEDISVRGNKEKNKNEEEIQRK